jgi:hypothetical protein
LPHTIKKILQNLLADGKTAQAIDQLRQLDLADKDLAQQILQNAARFSTLEKEQVMGTLRYDAYQLERNQINAALLAIVDKLPDEEADKPKIKPDIRTEKGKTFIQQADKIYNIDHIDNANFG